MYRSSLLAGLCLLAGLVHSQSAFLGEPVWDALRAESTGYTPYENLRYLTSLHRVPATPAFDEAATFMQERSREYGLEVRREEFAIDGEKRYGVMRSNLGWVVKHATLWQLEPEHVLVGDWQSDPVRLADYSRSARVETLLVDVGSGTQESDYAGKDVGGRIVLADGVLSQVQALAVMQHGAAGIVSDMPNQTTAWSGLDPTLIRWGHLDARLPRGFAFMVSRSGAEDLRRQLREHPVRLSADVEAEVGPGHWTVVSATIPGTDPNPREIVFSCHLDHQRPGANDNGSGCVTILESARILSRLIGEGKLPRPARTLRFIFGPEIEGTMAYLNAHPEIRRVLAADIHMDMVGGDPFKNKSILHVTATPWSLPSFVSDLGGTFAEQVRDASMAYAQGLAGSDPAIIEERNGAPGTRNPLLMDETSYDAGSDSDEYNSSTIAVPSIYLRDWPDIYIHTDHDALSMIDATKLRRAALIGAASGYALASLSRVDVPLLSQVIATRAQGRMAGTYERARRALPDAYEARNILHQALAQEGGALRNLVAFTGAEPAAIGPALRALELQSDVLESWFPAAHTPAWRSDPASRRVPRRIGAFGPLSYPNDNVLRDKLGPERFGRIKLLAGDASLFVSVHESGSLYAYEIINFIDGRRSVGEIRDAVSGEFGPVSLEVVADYLKACEEAGIIAYR